jgi:hypothetical protein
MHVNIIGAGPTGLTIAWELSKLDNVDVHVYDRKGGPGGSWWEPSENSRDLHAYRMVFDKAFVNTRDLFSEMGIEWSDIFTKMNDSSPFSIMFKNLYPVDYLALTTLSIKVLATPWIYKNISLHDAVGEVSPGAMKVLSAFTYTMDGVSWDTMSAYEFVKSYDWVALSGQYTQKVSGAVMSLKMEKALMERGVTFHYNKELLSVSYHSDSYEAFFIDTDQTLTGGLLVLAVDHAPAKWLVGENWGLKVPQILHKNKYVAITFLLEYDKPMKIPSDLEILTETPWRVLATVLPGDGQTVCVTLVDHESVSPHTGKSVKQSNPKELVDEVLRQTGLPPTKVKMCWGASWDGTRWIHEQSSGVLAEPVPFFGASNAVALCGMMSERETPFASIEAAVEVGRRFTVRYFGVGDIKKPLLITHVLFVILIFSLCIIYGKYKV